MAKERILVVDDEPGIRSSLAGVLKDEKYRVDAAASGEECLELCSNTLYDLVLLDVLLPGMDGLETLARLPQTPFSGMVIVISGHANIEMAVKAIKLGAFDFIEKPLSLEKTLVTVKNALRRKDLEDQNRQLRTIHRHELVGVSIPVLALRKQVDIIAPTNGRVLITGENGTGKELVARLIHENSLRKEKKFVPLACAAVPEDRIEADLFGYRKGAFPGAASDRKGKFEEAHEGTLFLDEVGDMSVALQSKLLRVLEEGQVEPLGATHPMSLDVRVIASTNKDLPGMMDAGQFREDLFYRLNVVPVHVVALRERREDIPVLADWFLNETSRQYGRKPHRVHPDATDVLARYAWPGNVRELKNNMERLAIMVKGEEISVYDLPVSMVVQARENGSHAERRGALNRARATFERQFISTALHRHCGDVEKAACELGVDPDSLLRKVQRLGIPSPPTER